MFDNLILPYVVELVIDGHGTYRVGRYCDINDATNEAELAANVGRHDVGNDPGEAREASYGAGRIVVEATPDDSAITNRYAVVIDTTDLSERNRVIVGSGIYGGREARLPHNPDKIPVGTYDARIYSRDDDSPDGWVMLTNARDGKVWYVRRALFNGAISDGRIEVA